MVATIDVLSPATVKEDKIALSLDPNLGTLLPSIPVTINVDYSAALPEGISLPLVFEVQPGTEEGGPERGYREVIYRTTKPDTLVFFPPAAGTYLVSLREIFHNRWQGRLTVTVEGDPYGETIERTRS